MRSLNGDKIEFEPVLTDLTHQRSCPMLNPMSDDFCTCGLEWRIRLRTEMEMHNAWRKRAEEAEQALAAHEEGGGVPRSTLRHLLVDMLNACGTTMRANQPGEIADRIFKFFEYHRALASQEPPATFKEWWAKLATGQLGQRYETLSPIQIAEMAFKAGRE